MKASRGIFFACDNNPRVLFQLKTCAESIRATHCDLPVYAVLLGDVDSETLDFLAEQSVTVINRQWTDYPRFLRRQPTFLKWFALEEGFDHDELLFLDADTFAYRDVAGLFEKVGPEDLHVRCAFQAIETDELEARGLLLVRPPGCMPAYLRRYHSLRKALRLPTVLGVNSGIMLFKNGTHERIRKHLRLFQSLRKMFFTGMLPYPMPTRFGLMDEVIIRLVVGAMGDVSFKEIPPELCPYYVDSFHSLASEPTILAHMFRGHYPHFLFTQIGRDTCQRYLDLRDRAPGKNRLRNALCWAWVFLINTAGLTWIGITWRSALARRVIREVTEDAAREKGSR